MAQMKRQEARNTGNEGIFKLTRTNWVDATEKTTIEITEAGKKYTVGRRQAPIRHSKDDKHWGELTHR